MENHAKLTKSQFEEIRKIGLFTGSRRFGALVSPESDWDYVVRKEQICIIAPQLEKIIEKDNYSNPRYAQDETVFVSIKAEAPKYPKP